MRFNIIESVAANLVGANGETFQAAGFALRQNNTMFERQIPLTGSADFLRTRLSADLPKPGLFLEVAHKLRTAKNGKPVQASVIRALDGPRLPEPAWRQQFDDGGWKVSLVGFRQPIRGLAGFYVSEAEVSETGIGITVFRVKPSVIEGKAICAPAEVASVAFELSVLGLARQKKFGDLVEMLEFEVPDRGTREKYLADLVAVLGLAAGNCEACSKGPHIHPVRPIERLLAGHSGEKAAEKPAEKSAPVPVPAPASAPTTVGAKQSIPMPPKRPAAVASQPIQVETAQPAPAAAPKPAPGKPGDAIATPVVSADRRDNRNNPEQQLHNQIVAAVKRSYGDRPFVPEIHKLADSIAAQISEENTVEKIVGGLNKNPYIDLDQRGIAYRMKIPGRDKVMLHLARLLAIPHGAGIFEEVEAHLEDVYTDLENETKKHGGDFYPVAESLKKEGYAAFCERHRIPPPPPEAHDTTVVLTPSADQARVIVKKLTIAFPKLDNEQASWLAPLVFVVGKNSASEAMGGVKRLLEHRFAGNFAGLVQACLNQTAVPLTDEHRRFAEALVAYIEQPDEAPQEEPATETPAAESTPAPVGEARPEGRPEPATDEVMAESSTTKAEPAADQSEDAGQTGGGRANLMLSGWLEPLRYNDAVTAAELKLAGKAQKGKKTPNLAALVSKRVPKDVAERILSLLTAPAAASTAAAEPNPADNASAAGEMGLEATAS